MSRYVIEVSARHTLHKWNVLAGTEMKIGKDIGSGGFYASLDNFGMSKTYKTPYDAAFHLLHENGCSMIHIDSVARSVISGESDIDARTGLPIEATPEPAEEPAEEPAAEWKSESTYGGFASMSPWVIARHSIQRALRDCPATCSATLLYRHGPNSGPFEDQCFGSVLHVAQWLLNHVDMPGEWRVDVSGRPAFAIRITGDATHMSQLCEVAENANGLHLEKNRLAAIRF